MFNALLAKARQQSGRSPPRPDGGDASSQDWAGAVPDRYSLKDLADLAIDRGTWEVGHIITALLTCAKHPDRVVREPDDDGVLGSLADLVCALSLAPPLTLVEGAAGRRHVDTATSCIALLCVLCLEWRASLSPDSLLLLVAYTDTTDRWTAPAAQEGAAQILAQQLPPGRGARAEFITRTLLAGFLKSAFSKNHNDKNNNSGGGAVYGEAEAPWKEHHPHAPSVLAWAVDNAEADTATHNWPLFMPPLLTLLADMDYAVRVRALDCVAVFLDRCDGRVVRGSGIAGVFEDAVFPSFGLLPSLTPEDQSAKVLGAAFKAAMRLAGRPGRRGGGRGGRGTLSSPGRQGGKSLSRPGEQDGGNLPVPGEQDGGIMSVPGKQNDENLSAPGRQDDSDVPSLDKQDTNSHPTPAKRDIDNPATAARQDDSSSCDLRLLDRILRDGVLVGYEHAHEYPRLSELLLEWCGRVVAEMGIHATKHLKNLLPIYSAALTNPFAVHHQGSLLAAIYALQETIVAAWPRMSADDDGGHHHAYRVVEMVSMCWLNVLDNDACPPRADQGHGIIEERLRHVCSILGAIVSRQEEAGGTGGGAGAAKLSALLAKEPRLGPLFVECLACQ